MKKLFKTIMAISITGISGVSILSCGNEVKSEPTLSDEIISESINNRYVSFSSDSSWGVVTPEVAKNIISQLSKQLNLTAQEENQLSIDPNLKKLDETKLDDKNEYQDIMILVGSIGRATIHLNWELTADQLPIWPIREVWGEITSDDIRQKKWSFYDESFNVWNEQTGAWNTETQNVLNLNQTPLKEDVQNSFADILFSYLPNYQYLDGDIKQSDLINYLKLPDMELNVGQETDINNIFIKNGNAEFPLLYYPHDEQYYNNVDWFNPEPLNISYYNDYYLVNILKTISSISLYSEDMNEASNAALDSHNRDLIREEIRRHYYDFNYPITSDLSFSGELKIAPEDNRGMLNDIKVLYKGVDQLFTIPVHVKGN